MRHLVAFGVGIGAVALFVAAATTRAAEEKPKYTIKQVMQAHKKGELREKILEGKGTKEDKQKLVEMYDTLHVAKPPMGDVDHWKKLTGEMLEAAKDVAANKEGSIPKLKDAVKCKECHDAHKPK